jgi:prevent-host-death family protein
MLIYVHIKCTSGGIMDVAIKELRKRPTHYIELASKGTDIIVTNRGSAVAKIVPCGIPEIAGTSTDALDALFGIWQSHDDIGDPLAYVQDLRKARSFR